MEDEEERSLDGTEGVSEGEEADEDEEERRGVEEVDEDSGVRSLLSDMNDWM